jgi:hypothetical protein
VEGLYSGIQECPFGYYELLDVIEKALPNGFIDSLFINTAGAT